ncbi:unnamed protein product [Prunus armeniaca]
MGLSSTTARQAVTYLIKINTSVSSIGLFLCLHFVAGLETRDGPGKVIQVLKNKIRKLIFEQHEVLAFLSHGDLNM